MLGWWPNMDAITQFSSIKTIKDALKFPVLSIELQNYDSAFIFTISITNCHLILQVLCSERIAKVISKFVWVMTVIEGV